MQQYYVVALVRIMSFILVVCLIESLRKTTVKKKKRILCLNTQTLFFFLFRIDLNTQQRTIIGSHELPVSSICYSPLTSKKWILKMRFMLRKKK